MDEKVRVAIAGVGCNASALVQGAAYYEATEVEEGLMTPRVAGYGPGSVEVVAAFDVTEEKVGRDLSDAIFAPPNVARRILSVPASGVIVEPGPLSDGMGRKLREVASVNGSGTSPQYVVEVLRAAEADVLLNFLPVGAEADTRTYAEAALMAGVAFVNAIPVFIASDPEWAGRFREAGLPLIGDDLKSQLGATAVHRALMEAAVSRGVQVGETYQCNIGGGPDFRNMMERERLASKRESKTGAVLAAAGGQAPDVHVSPSDYVPFLRDRKVAFIRLEGEGFAGNRIEVEARFETEDSPNAAAVAYDAVRWAKLALDQGVSGPLETVSAYLMKAPPRQIPDPTAAELVRGLALVGIADEAVPAET